MRTILTVLIAITMFNITAKADECKVNYNVISYDNGKSEIVEVNKVLKYKVFTNNHEAITYAKEHGLLENLITDQDTKKYLVFEQLPQTNFVCVPNYQL